MDLNVTQRVVETSSVLEEAYPRRISHQVKHFHLLA
jgi:hypothetical protein